MTDYAFGLIVSGSIAAAFLLAGFWPRPKRRNFHTGLRSPMPDPRSSIERHKRELGL